MANQVFTPIAQPASTNSKVLDTEQFSRIVGAIAEGKYSWACVLILRFGGYNPALYLPYRTYKRLIKENNTEFRNHHPR